MKIDKYTAEIANLYRATTYDSSDSLVDGIPVAFAKFHRDDESLEPWVDLTAEIEFLNPEGDLLYRVDRAYWWKREDHHSDVVSIRVGHTEKMIIAIVGDKKQVHPYSGHYVTVDRSGINQVKDFVLETRDRPIQGATFLVRINFLGTKGGNRILKKSFEYELLTEPDLSFRLKGKGST